METVYLLSPIATKACQMDNLDPQSKGDFLRLLCVCSDLDQDKCQLLFECIIDALRESELLASCEFHEGLDGVLTSRRLSEVIFGAYPEGSAEQISEIVIDLYSSKLLKPDRETWELFRTNLSSTEFRQMLVKLGEASCDNVFEISRVLEDVFDPEEDFEIAECIRMVLDTHWIMDILPQKRKAASRMLHEVFTRPYPSAKKAVDDFCEEVLRVEPRSGEPEAAKVASPSSDSDVESRGSLDAFVVDSDEDEAASESASSSESELSSSASSSSSGGRHRHKKRAKGSKEDGRMVRHKQRKLRRSPSDSSNSEYI